MITLYAEPHQSISYFADLLRHEASIQNQLVTGFYNDIELTAYPQCHKQHIIDIYFLKLELKSPQITY